MHGAVQVPAGQSYTHLAYGAHDVIAAGLERTIHLIDASSGALLQVIKDAHAQLVYLQWSPVSRRIGEWSASYTLLHGTQTLLHYAGIFQTTVSEDPCWK